MPPTRGLATGNSKSDRERQNSSYYDKPQRTPSRTILVKSKENKQRDEEKVREIFKDNAIKRMLEEKRQKERQQQQFEEEKTKENGNVLLLLNMFLTRGKEFSMINWV